MDVVWAALPPCQPQAWWEPWAQECRALPLVGSLVGKSQNVRASYGDGRCGPWCQNSPGSMSPLPLPSCGMWGQWLCFFVPQIPHLQNGNENTHLEGCSEWRPWVPCEPLRSVGLCHRPQPLGFCAPHPGLHPGPWDGRGLLGPHRGDLPVRRRATAGRGGHAACSERGHQPI